MMQPITLHAVLSGPNSWKAAIILEELAVPYKIEFHSLSEIKQTPFILLNPNGRVPVIEDPNTGMTVWESGAILEYLVETYDKEGKLTYDNAKQKFELKSWVFFQTSGQGPYWGQAGWFLMFHPEKLPSAQKRYMVEVKRTLSVLDDHLAKSSSGWLVGDKFTYADAIFEPWNAWCGMLMAAGGDLEPFNIDEYPHFKAWQAKLEGREAIKKVTTMSQEAMGRSQQGHEK